MFNESAAVILIHQVRMHGTSEFRVIAIEENAGVGAQGSFRFDQRRVPVVTAEHLVGTLTALHHLDVP